MQLQGRLPVYTLRRSPSINVDAKWNPPKKYTKKSMKVDTDKEEFFFVEFIPEELEKVVETQHKTTE